MAMLHGGVITSSLTCDNQPGAVGCILRHGNVVGRTVATRKAQAGIAEESPGSIGQVAR